MAAGNMSYEDAYRICTRCWELGPDFMIRAIDGEYERAKGG